MRGGVKGRLEIFRKFIRFGRGKRPLNVLVRYNLYIFLECIHTLLMTEADNRKEGLVFFTSHLILAQ